MPLDLKLVLSGNVTRRPALSTICSLNDPSGFSAPVMITAKVFMQEICRHGASWNEPLSEDERTEWKKLVNELKRLHDVGVPRCLKPSQIITVPRWQLLQYCDASARVYAAVGYLRMETNAGQIYCVFPIGKTCVVPLKSSTILTAAVLATQLDRLDKREVPLDLSEFVF